MARVTVEDCLEYVVNRFALVHATSKRVKQIFKGSRPLINCDNREIVTALREIGAGYIEVEMPDSDDKVVQEQKSRPKKGSKGKNY